MRASAESSAPPAARSASLHSSVLCPPPECRAAGWAGAGLPLRFPGLQGPLSFTSAHACRRWFSPCERSGLWPRHELACSGVSGRYREGGGGLVGAEHAARCPARTASRRRPAWGHRHVRPILPTRPGVLCWARRASRRGAQSSGWSTQSWSTGGRRRTHAGPCRTGKALSRLSDILGKAWFLFLPCPQ